MKLFVLDVDGVMTDGKKYYDGQGNVMCKQYNDKDFTAIKRFLSLGIHVCFLSGDNWNKVMADKRNIKFYSGRSDKGKMDKIDILNKILNDYKVLQKNCLYIGDDIFDIEVLKVVGYSFCPVDSPKCVKDTCTVLTRNGGDGVIAELFDYLVDKEIIKIPSIDDVKNLDSLEATSKDMS